MRSPRSRQLGKCFEAPAWSANSFWLHAHIKTTQRYAHLSDETLISAANTAGGFMPGAVAQPLVPS